MFITNASISYGGDKVWEALSEEDKANFAVSFPDLVREGGSKPYLYGDHIMDDCDVQWLTSHGFEVTLKRIRGLTGISGRYSDPAAMPTGVTHVHVPNVGLLTIDEVDWMEDACTQDLQSRLDDGWRILAVCPPNSARRPDYILGRTKKENY